MPGLVIAMLEAIDVDAEVDHALTVLEVGTAAGYNAALLCKRLGDDNVTTLDISPELTALARVRLAEHGYQPYVVAGDGAQHSAPVIDTLAMIGECTPRMLPSATLAAGGTGRRPVVPPYRLPPLQVKMTSCRALENAQPFRKCTEADLAGRQVLALPEY